MKYSLLMILLCFINVCFAEVYEVKDGQGHIVYSDVPSANATEITISPSQTKTVAPTSIDKNGTSKEDETKKDPLLPVKEEHKPYTAMFINTPMDQQTFQNEREIAVNLRIVPELQQGDKVQLILDGRPYGQPVAGTHLILGQVDRGSHQLSAVILDENEKVIKQSNAITVFIQYARLGAQNAS